MEDSSTGDDPFRDEEDYGQNPQTNALLALAMSQAGIGLGSKEDDIDEALKRFGIPLPESLRQDMWNGLRGRDEAKWIEAYHQLEDFVNTHEEDINRDQALEVLENLLHDDQVGQTEISMENFLAYDPDTSTEWKQAVNQFRSGLPRGQRDPPPKRKKVPPTQKFERWQPPTEKFERRAPTPRQKADMADRIRKREELQVEKEKRRVAEIKKLSSPQKTAKHAIDYHVPGLLKQIRKGDLEQPERLTKLLKFLEDKPFPSQYSKADWTERAYQLKLTMLKLNHYYSKFPGGEKFEFADEDYYKKLYDERFSGTSDQDPTLLILDAVEKYYLPMEEQIAQAKSIPKVPKKQIVSIPQKPPARVKKTVVKEKPKPPPAKGNFEPYTMDDLMIRVDAALYFFHSPDWYEGALQKIRFGRKTAYRFMTDENQWIEEMKKTGWYVDPQIFKQWFGRMQKKIDPSLFELEGRTPKEAYVHFEEQFRDQLYKWIHSPDVDFQVDKEVLDYWVGAAIDSKKNTLATEMEDWYMNPDWHEGQTFPELQQNVNRIFQSVKKNVSETPPKPRFGTEALPYEITLHHHNNEWAAEYDQFFGTQICMAAKRPSNREFLQEEFYKLWVRGLLKDGMPREKIEKVQLPMLMRQIVPTKQFGIIPTRVVIEGRKKQSELYSWYQGLKKNKKKGNNAIWRKVARTADENEEPLKTSNFVNRKSVYLRKNPLRLAEKRRRASPKLTLRTSKKVKFTEPKMKKEVDDPELHFIKEMYDPKTYLGLINTIKKEARENKRGKFKSVKLVSEYLTFQGDNNLLVGLLDKIETSDDNKAKGLWGGLMNDYVLMVNTLGVIPRGLPVRNFVASRSNMKYAVSDRCLNSLRMLHKRLVSVMVHRELGGKRAVENYRKVAEQFYPELLRFKEPSETDIESVKEPTPPRPTPEKRPRPQPSEPSLRKQTLTEQAFATQLPRSRATPPSLELRTPKGTPQQTPDVTPFLYRSLQKYWMHPHV